MERFLEQARDKLNMQAPVRLYRTGGEDRGHVHAKFGQRILVVKKSG